MIHVHPAEEPTDFNEKVRVPGARAIAEKVGKTPAVPRTSGRAFEQCSHRVQRPDGTTAPVLITREEDLPAAEFPPLWARALDDLMEAYHRICAYSCFRIHRVTGGRSVDHMAPKSRTWEEVYEWRNYRLCCSLLNARKSNFGDVLDPFEVEDGWFVLNLVSYQVLPAPAIEENLRQQVLMTIERLGLNGAAFRKSREEDVHHYEAGVPFEVLLKESPFVARELRRQGQLRRED